MKTKELINADIFIIPTHSVKYPKKELKPCQINVWQRIIDQYYATRQSVDDGLSDVYFEEFVEVSFVTRKDGYNSKHSDWFAYGVDGYDELAGLIPVSCYLPKSLFKDHKEGDTITFPIVLTGCGLSMSKEYQDAHNKFINDEIPAKEYRKILRKLEKSKSIDFDLEVRTRVKISVRLAQKDYKYRNFGTFEETLKKIYQQKD